MLRVLSIGQLVNNLLFHRACSVIIHRRVGALMYSKKIQLEYEEGDASFAGSASRFHMARLNQEYSTAKLSPN